jgi:hypothetical protein
MTFHYERRHKPNGSFWYAQRVVDTLTLVESYALA